jgi:hypothetical protein|tara:strand:- start:1547 stop:1894 length:348 start_codon:yes stop_codon:yes gene_type:complete
MKKFIFCSILFSFLSGFAYAEEKKSELVLGTIMTTLPAHCATTKEMVKVFKNDQVVFTGMVDQANVFKVYLKPEGIWTSMLSNVSGISCIYFSGMPGILSSKKAIKKDTSVRIWE